jgi:uncharacterized protein YlxW (UPF0749 family)
MSPKTKNFLNEKNIYVSWGILVVVLSITWMIAQALEQLKQVIPVIAQVQTLQNQMNTLQFQVNTLQTQLEISQRDIGKIKEKLQIYDVEFKK